MLEYSPLVTIYVLLKLMESLTFLTFLWMNPRDWPNNHFVWQPKHLPRPSRKVCWHQNWDSEYSFLLRSFCWHVKWVCWRFITWNSTLDFCLKWSPIFCSDIKQYSWQLLAYDSWLAELGNTAAACWNILPYIFAAMWLLSCFHKLFKKKISLISLWRHFA